MVAFSFSSIIQLIVWRLYVYAFKKCRPFILVIFTAIIAVEMIYELFYIRQETIVGIIFAELVHLIFAIHFWKSYRYMKKIIDFMQYG